MKTKFITLLKKELAKENFEPIKNRKMFVKPDGGLWSSTYIKDGEYLSEWHEFSSEEELKTDSSIQCTFEIKDSAKICTIDSLHDLILLLNNYKLDDGFIYKEFLDFEKLALDYDAIHLTSEGQWNTRLTSPDLYGWDVETMLVLNYDVIENIEVL